MKLLLANNIGFCFGVTRAIDMAKEAAKHGSVKTLGPLIHNGSVIKELEGEGIFSVQSLDDVTSGETLVIRAHGAPKGAYEDIQNKGIHLVDATCPKVKKIHHLVEEACGRGKDIIVIGKQEHPEIQGIVGWCDRGVYVVNSQEDVDRLPYGLDAFVVVQTTYQQQAYEELLQRIRGHCNGIEAVNTICSATTNRQKEAIEIAKQADVMLVIGDPSSANTAKLKETCKKYCKNTVFIEEPDHFFLEIIHTDDIIGIVAGASTPERMIREVITRMSELEKTMAGSPEVENNEIEKEAEAAVEQPIDAVSAAQEVAAAPQAEAKAEEPKDDAGESSFAEAFEKTLVRIRNGQIIKGSVVQILDGEVSVNIGYKSDGYIPRNEFSSDPDVNPADVVAVGDEIEVEILKVNDGEGNVLLSRKSVESKKFWDDFIKDAENTDKVYDAVGKEVVKGGLIASINGIRAFVPASHVAIRYVENLNDYVGKPMKLKVIETDKSRKRIVASQKLVQQAEAEAAKKEKWAQIEPGAKIKGIVRRLTDFGAFVDIGGVDGLIHVTDVAWGRVKRPSDVLSVDQEVEVVVLSVDPEKERVSLGYKQLQPKPWTLASEKYPVGSIVEGKVVRIVPFGAFVALEPTIDGLIHISQVAARRIDKVEDELNVGDMVRCKVLEVSPEAKRISLSRKEVILEENPELAAEIEQEKQKEREERQAQRQSQADRQPKSSEPRERKERKESKEPREHKEPRENRESKEAREPRERKIRTEEGTFELPPLQTATTSLADLFAAFKDNADEE